VGGVVTRSVTDVLTPSEVAVSVNVPSASASIVAYHRSSWSTRATAGALDVQRAGEYSTSPLARLTRDPKVKVSPISRPVVLASMYTSTTGACFTRTPTDEATPSITAVIVATPGFFASILPLDTVAIDGLVLIHCTWRSNSSCPVASNALALI
jgi:hypothetical protein